MSNSVQSIPPSYRTDPGTAFPVEPVRAGRAYFLLRGDFDVFNRAQLSQVLAAAAQAPAMTIDLRDVSFIDAGVLGTGRHRRDTSQTPCLADAHFNANAGLKRLFLVGRLLSSFRFEEGDD